MTTVPGTYVTFVASGNPVNTNVETTVYTTRAISSPYPGSVFAIEFSCDVTTGTGTTAIIARIRETNAGGTVVATSASIAAAASTVLPRLFIAGTDTLPGDVAGQVWVLTITQTGGTGNGSVVNGFTRVTQVT